MLDTIADPARREQMHEVAWMPSHKSLAREASTEERRDHAGNELADAAAKGGRERRPYNGAEAQRGINFYTRRAKLIAKAIAVAMAMWPQRQRG